jgi:hypothetical protein
VPPPQRAAHDGHGAGHSPQRHTHCVAMRTKRLRRRACKDKGDHVLGRRGQGSSCSGSEHLPGHMVMDIMDHTWRTLSTAQKCPWSVGLALALAEGKTAFCGLPLAPPPLWLLIMVLGARLTRSAQRRCPSRVHTLQSGGPPPNPRATAFALWSLPYRSSDTEDAQLEIYSQCQSHEAVTVGGCWPRTLNLKHPYATRNL